LEEVTSTLNEHQRQRFGKLLGSWQQEVLRKTMKTKMVKWKNMKRNLNHQPSLERAAFETHVKEVWKPADARNIISMGHAASETNVKEVWSPNEANYVITLVRRLSETHVKEINGSSTIVEERVGEQVDSILEEEAGTNENQPLLTIRKRGKRRRGHGGLKPKEDKTWGNAMPESALNLSGIHLDEDEK
jgi:hypothetical protein